MCAADPNVQSHLLHNSNEGEFWLNQMPMVSSYIWTTYRQTIASVMLVLGWCRLIACRMRTRKVNKRVACKQVNTVFNTRYESERKIKTKSNRINILCGKISHKSLCASKKIFGMDLMLARRNEGCEKLAKAQACAACTHTASHDVPVCHQYSLPPTFIPTHAREIGNRNTRSRRKLAEWKKQGTSTPLMNMKESWCLSSGL